MRKQDWQAAFGAPSDEFNRKVLLTLDSIPKEEIVMKKKLVSSILAAMIAVMTICGAALAMSGGWGVLDFVNSGAYEMTQPGLSDADRQALVQSPALTFETADVVFTLSEAVFDGRQLGVTMHAAPKQPDEVLLISNYCYLPDDPYPVAEGEAPITFAEKAAQEGKRLVYVGMSIPGGEWSGGNESFNADGSITLYGYNLYDDIPEADKGFTCRVYQTDGSAITGEQTGTFEMTATALTHAAAQGEFALGCQVIEQVQVSRSTIGMYLTMSGHMADGLTAAQLEQLSNTSLKVYAPDGAEIASSQGGLTILDDAGECIAIEQVKGGERFEYNMALAAGSSMPDVLTLRSYDFTTGKTGDGTEIALTAE